MRLLAALHVEDADFSGECPLRDAVRAVQVEVKKHAYPLTHRELVAQLSDARDASWMRRGARPSTCTRTKWQPS
eukprot:7854977-Alexandrium_andersonii.AAC.1